MKRFTPIFLIVGTIVAAFLGVIGGTEFIEWQKQRHYEKKVEGLAAGESTLFRKGQKFPKIDLVGLDGRLTDTHSLNTGKHSLYLFLSVGCDPCTKAISSWIKFEGQMPDNVEIFGLCEDDIDYTQLYIKKTGFPYPVYCDTNYVFSSKYDMDVYPSAIGVKSDGIIAFVQHGIGDNFSPLEAAERLLNQ